MVYSTEQRKILLEFFEHNKDKVFSASQIAQSVTNKDISTSAVYRNLKALEDDKKIKRLAKAGERTVYYQYVDCASCKGHLHLSCTSCGDIMHLPDEQSAKIEQAMLDSHFNLDKSSTVLYGVCEKCKNKEKKKSK